MNKTYTWQPFPDVMPPYDRWLFVTAEVGDHHGTPHRRVWHDVIATIHPEDEEVFFFQPGSTQWDDETPVEGVIAWMQYPDVYNPEESEA